MHLFLRDDEIINLGFFSLIEDNTICNKDGTIAGLLVNILGKTEKQKNVTSHDYNVMGYAHSSVVMSS